MYTTPAKKRAAAQAYIRTPEGKAARYRACKAWRERNRIKELAHRAVARALKTGALVRLACERCGDPNTEAHHDDYTKPLDIKWLCDIDHKARHHELKAAGIKP